MRRRKKKDEVEEKNLHFPEKEQRINQPLSFPLSLFISLHPHYPTVKKKLILQDFFFFKSYGIIKKLLLPPSYLHVVNGPPAELPGDGIVQPDGDPGVHAALHLQDGGGGGGGEGQEVEQGGEQQEERFDPIHLSSRTRNLQKKFFFLIFRGLD